MDVTRSIGALRAADARVPAARESGPAFESFLPRDGASERTTGRRDADRLARAERETESRRADDLQKRRADERRAEERRLEQREAEERRTRARRDARRAEERRVEERRAEERRAERERAEEAEARRAEDARATRSDVQIDVDIEPDLTAQTPDADLALLAGGAQLARTAVATEADLATPAADVQRPGAAEAAIEMGHLGRVPGRAELAGPTGAGGVRGLVEWLQSRPGQSDGPRAQRAMDLMAGQADDAQMEVDGESPIAMADGADGVDGAALDAELDADPTRELTRLLEGRKATGDLFDGNARETRGETVRLGSQPQTPAGVPGVGGPTVSPTARIADVSAAARAGTTPTALPEGVDESSIMRQISDALRLRNGRPGRAQTAEIALNPAELGRVRIKIRMEGGSARVLVSAEHAAVGDLLGSGLEQLRRDLMAQGVHVAHLEVRSGLADEGGGRGDAREQDDVEEREAAPEAKPGKAPAPKARQPRSRIDVEA